VLKKIQCNKFKNYLSLFLGNNTSFIVPSSDEVNEKTITVSSVFTTILYWFNIHYADTFEIKLFPEWPLENSNGREKTIFVLHMSTKNLYVMLRKAVKTIIRENI